MPSSLVGQVTRAGPHMDSFPIFVSHIHPLPPHSCGSIWTSGGYPVKDHSSIMRLHPVANTENSGPCLMLPFHSWRTQDPEKHGSCTMTNPTCTQEQKESRMVPAALGTTCDLQAPRFRGEGHPWGPCSSCATLLQVGTAGTFTLYSASFKFFQWMFFNKVYKSS